ncbi:hypothetical protein GCM10020258_28470 [Sphingomonas yabuuchiae]
MRRLPVVNVYSVAELALMAVLAVQGARLLWVIVTPVSPLGEWRPLAPAIAGSPAAILEGFDPFFRLQGQQAAPAAVTTLQLTLFGTRLDEASGRGSAILAGPDGVQRSVSVGEEIQPGVTLKAVAFDHITIDRGGATEDLYLDQSDAPPAAAGAPTPAAPSVQAPGSVPRRAAWRSRSCAATSASSPGSTAGASRAWSSGRRARARRSVQRACARAISSPRSAGVR